MMELNITEIVPTVTPEIEARIRHALDELGVLTDEDLALVREDDLANIVKPIAARRLVAAWARKKTDNQEQAKSTCSGTDMSHCQPGTSAVKQVEGADWSLNYSIPWDQFPQDLIRSCESGRIPAISDRLQMIRTLAESVRAFSSNIKKEDIKIVCSKIVAKYPESFKDKVGGTVIGDGLNSLSKQLKFRLANVKQSAKHQRSSGAPAVSPKKKKQKQDEYGCCDWSPPVVDAEEDERSRKYLIGVWAMANRDMAEVQEKMRLTFASQRVFLNRNMSVSAVQENWRFLFEQECMYEHYGMLTGKDNAKANIMEALEKYCRMLFE